MFSKENGKREISEKMSTLASTKKSTEAPVKTRTAYCIRSWVFCQSVSLSAISETGWVMSEAINQSSPTDDDRNWNYYIWECTVTHPSMRPRGRKQTDGCGHHNLRKTKKTIGDESAQSKCSKCGRRKRLSKQNLYMRLFTDRRYAEKAQNELNEGEWEWDGSSSHQ